MKLLLVIVRDDDAFNILDVLIEEGFMVTRISSTGGFLKKGNTTLLIGIQEERLEEVTKIINNNIPGGKCVSFRGQTEIISKLSTNSPDDLPVRATIFIIDVERFEKF